VGALTVYVSGVSMHSEAPEMVFFLCRTQRPLVLASTKESRGRKLGVLLTKSGLGVPRWARAGRSPIAHTYHLQVAFGVLGSREGLS
jgi:hypothetical protein